MFTFVQSFALATSENCCLISDKIFYFKYFIAAENLKVYREKQHRAVMS